jgi:hypothetical protein
MRYSAPVLIQAPDKAKVHLYLWTVVFLFGLWAFWNWAQWWAQIVTAVLTVWSWVGVVASARAHKYGFYDPDQPDSEEEKAIAARSSYLPIPLALLTLLLLLKIYVFR